MLLAMLTAKLCFLLIDIKLHDLQTMLHLSYNIFGLCEILYFGIILL